MTTLAPSISSTHPVRELWAMHAELVKLRLSGLVAVTAAAGFVLGAPAGSLDWSGLFLTVVGTTLAAFSAAAFNQLIERRRDARMHRTRNRPIPAGRISPRHAYVAGVLLGMSGLTMLALAVNPLAAGLALSTILLYVAVYTPMKTRSTLNTVVGAVVGAIPPMIGWAGSAGTLETGAWLLGGLLMIWQLPHFLALAWMYRADYERGAFRMLPSIDPDGSLTSGVILLSSLALVGLVLASALAGLGGALFVLGAGAAGIWMSVRALAMVRATTVRNARRVFLASLVHLPVVLVLLILDPGPIGAVGVDRAAGAVAVAPAGIDPAAGPVATDHAP